MAVPGGGTLITAGEKFARLGPTVHYVQRLLASHENTDKESGNGTKLMAGQHAIQNKGGDGPWTFLHSQGVQRDIFNQQVAAVRFQDPMTMRLDGAVKVGEGVTPFVSKWNVPGRAVLMPTGSIQRWFLNPMPGTPQAGS